MDNGGQAFPGQKTVIQQHNSVGEYCETIFVSGMTLRDYAEIEFTKAWIGVLGDVYEDYGVTINSAIVKGKEQADAFISQRKPSEGS